MRELTDDEKRQIETREDYVKFIDRTSRIVERAMTEIQVDIFADYTGERDSETMG